MAKRRYILELTEAQLQQISAALEVFELDMCGGGEFGSGVGTFGNDKRMENAQRGAEQAIQESRNKGMKTIK